MIGSVEADIRLIAICDKSRITVARIINVRTEEEGREKFANRNVVANLKPFSVFYQLGLSNLLRNLTNKCHHSIGEASIAECLNDRRRYAAGFKAA